MYNVIFSGSLAGSKFNLTSTTASQNILTMKPELHIDTYSLQKAAHAYRAINNKLKQKILHLIHQNKEIKATDIHKHLKIDQPVASMHLAILRKAKKVQTKKEGRFVYYSINYDRIHHIHKQSEKLLKDKVAKQKA
ncbi:MAG: transcriptional regulator [Chitinophagaceae bacterium]